LLFPLPVLPPLGAGAAVTGAGAADVVTGGGEDCVVTGGAAVVVTEWVVEAVVATGLGLCTTLWCATFLWCAAGSAVVFEVVLVADAAAVDVELVFEVLVPPQPATARATAIVLSTSFFIIPLRFSLPDLRPPGYKTLRAHDCSGKEPTERTTTAALTSAAHRSPSDTAQGDGPGGRFRADGR
jgi:hypothetical protein